MLSQVVVQEPTARPTLPVPPPPRQDAEATKASALLQPQAAAAEPACQEVMDAVHGLQNESTPAENRHDAAQVDFEVAGALLDALKSPAVEIADTSPSARTAWPS